MSEVVTHTAGVGYYVVVVAPETMTMKVVLFWASFSFLAFFPYRCFRWQDPYYSAVGLYLVFP